MTPTGLAPSPLPTATRAPAASIEIAGLAVIDPPRTLTQTQVLELLGLDEDEFALRIFGRCGVRERRLELTPERLRRTLQGRTEAIEQELFSYAVSAVEALRIDPQEIGTVVTSTLYSLGGPTLAHRLVEHFEMDPTTDKYHVQGVGCASAVPLVRLAGQALRDRPGKQGLVVAAESMSGLLSRAREDDARSKTVGSSIFGDGCGAMLLDGAQTGSGPSVLASRVHQVPGTLHAVRMEVAAEDSYLHLIQELPDVAGEHVGGLVEEFLRENGLSEQMIRHWLIHPGGRRIIECVQTALGLSHEDVRVSYDVLASHGNVGTPSIFYVMNETVARRRPGAGEHGLMVTIGPGVTVGLMLLRW